MTSAGILLVDKKPGLTSFRSLGSIKKRICPKVGHAGTLDKFAEGLLVVLVGPMTKLNPLFTGLDKTYRVSVCFGSETDTLDPEGRVTAEGPVPDEDAVMDAVSAFVGPQMQRPPDYSAVHVNGRRAYKSAVAGEQVDIPQRPITIYSITDLTWAAPVLEMTVSCSKGTYIRSLARDMGRSLGTYAYVTKLKRTRVGPFRLEDAVDADLAEPEDLITGRTVFTSIGDFSFCRIRDEYAARIHNGMLPKASWCESIDSTEGSGLCAVYDTGDRLLALAEIGREGDNRVVFTRYLFVVPAGTDT